VTFVGGEQAVDVGKIASELNLHAEFASAGLGHAGRSHGRNESGGGGGRNGGGSGPRGGGSGPRGGYGGGRNKRRPRSSSGTGSTAGSGRGSRHGGGETRKVASARPSRRSGRH
jgi:hypothetical protein